VSVGRRTLTVFLATTAVVLAVPAVGYGVGLSRIDGKPTPADPSQYTNAQLQEKWRHCRESSSIAVEPLNPWGYTAKILWGTTDFTGNGELAAWLIAREHNGKHLKGGMAWWHLSGAALTIWVTRNWSAKEIAATLVRDNLCK
jgi:hypothetical protein